MLYTPAFVDTPLVTPYRDKPVVKATLISPEVAVKACLRDLGFKQDGVSVTCGTLGHHLVGSGLTFLFNNVISAYKAVLADSSAPTGFEKKIE